ncbi:DUF1697 domain-containing protein [Yoonia sp. SS1-5]|uniref:DUF1697 domain-containing protein n=1 Tax=Yoonia rhodophyticola TaxID=3137370 RepID=A0AAN0NHV1_9RHOB
MTQWVAFLRGINVGGHRKIPMASLRKIWAAQTGIGDVRSYIASGNLVFTGQGPADDLAAGLQAVIADTFGFDVPVLVLSAKTMRDLVGSCPFAQAPGNRVHAYLCYTPPVVDWDGVRALQTASEDVAVIGNVVWLHVPDGIGRSKLAARLEHLIGVPATARNLNTIHKMHGFLDGSGD